MNAENRAKYPELNYRRVDSLGQDFTYIYAIRRRDTQEVKIGISNCPPQRLELLQTAHGAPLELAGFVRGNCGDEGNLHSRFSVHRKLGEWFHEAPEITEWIEGLSDA